MQLLNTSLSVKEVGFDSRANRIGHSRQRLATATAFLRSFVAQALSREDEPRLPPLDTRVQ